MSTRQAYINGIGCIEHWILEGLYTQEQCVQILSIMENLRDGIMPDELEFSKKLPANVDPVEGYEQDPAYKIINFYAPGEPNENAEAMAMLKELHRPDKLFVFPAVV